MSTTFDCPRSPYCGDRNCLSVARNLVGVRPRGENCFDEAAPSDFISGVNRFRTSRGPVRGVGPVASDRPPIFANVSTLCGCGRHYSQSQSEIGRNSKHDAGYRSHAPSCLVLACPTLRTDYRHYFSRRSAFKISRRSIRAGIARYPRGQHVISRSNIALSSPRYYLTPAESKYFTR